MAKSKKKAEVKEVERKVLSNGVILVKYDDGSYALLTPIPAEDAEELFNGGEEKSDDSDEDEDEDEDSSDDVEDDDDEDDSDDEDEDEDERDDEDEDGDGDEEGDDDDEDGDGDEEGDDDDEDDDPITGEALAEMDFEELEDLCDDKELDTDPDEFDEEDVDKLRKAIAKEMGITLPKASKKDSKKKKK